MKKGICLLVLLWLCIICKSQNLIPNGSFELFTGCPNNYSQIDSCISWMNPSTLGSPDYFNGCAVGTPAGVPDNLMGFQRAQDGVCYTGIFMGQPSGINVREYLEVPLITPLLPNTCYHFQMYVSLADRSRYTTHDIGVYFSDTPITNVNNYNVLPVLAQINNLIGNSFDTLNWTYVEGEYTAVGNEAYLLIGNFKDNPNTTFSLVNASSPLGSVYCYIDNVSLVPMLPCVTAIQDQRENSILDIYPNPCSSLLTIKNQQEILQLKIFDLIGQEVFYSTVNNSIVEIDVSKFENGIYFAQVEMRGRTLVQKFVKGNTK